MQKDTYDYCVVQGLPSRQVGLVKPFVRLHPLDVPEKPGLDLP
jgi:hypothetical protein